MRVKIIDKLILIVIFVYMFIPKHIKRSYIAKELYPHLSQKVATAKFHNKLNEVGYCKLTKEEIKKIEEIIK